MYEFNIKQYNPIAFDSNHQQKPNQNLKQEEKSIDQILNNDEKFLRQKESELNHQESKSNEKNKNNDD